MLVALPGANAQQDPRARRDRDKVEGAARLERDGELGAIIQPGLASTDRITSPISAYSWPSSTWRTSLPAGSSSVGRDHRSQNAQPASRKHRCHATTFRSDPLVVIADAAAFA
jgi:hypothetical protein